MKLVNDAGYYLFVVTNQAGVAKGLYGEEAIGTLHRWMAEELGAVGASIDDWRYCPYHPEGVVAEYSGRTTGASRPRACSRPVRALADRAARQLSRRRQGQ